MQSRLAAAIASAAMFAGLAGAAVPAAAQEMGMHQDVPVYNSWQHGWDRNRFDRHHVKLGTVVSFHAYRLEMRKRNGDVETIDLKNGTVIRPTGATPQRGNRVAVVGYYSNGTFIANRVVLR